MSNLTFNPQAAVLHAALVSPAASETSVERAADAQPGALAEAALPNLRPGIPAIAPEAAPGISRRAFLAAAAAALAGSAASGQAQEAQQEALRPGIESAAGAPHRALPCIAACLHDYNSFNAAVLKHYEARGVKEIHPEWQWDRILPAVRFNLLRVAPHFTQLDEGKQVDVVMNLFATSIRRGPSAQR